MRIAPSDGRRAQAALQQTVPQLERRLVRRVPLTVPDLDRVELLNRVPITPVTTTAQRERMVDRDECAESVRARGDRGYTCGVAGANAEVYDRACGKTPSVDVAAVGRDFLAAHDEQFTRQVVGARDIRVVARSVVVGDEDEVEVVVVCGLCQLTDRPLAVAVEGVQVQVACEPAKVSPNGSPARISFPGQQLCRLPCGGTFSRAGLYRRATACLCLDDDFDFNVHARGRDLVETEDDAPTARG